MQLVNRRSVEANLRWAGSMSLGRRKVGLEEQSRWVFNRMAVFYPSRPAYPAALFDALAELAGPVGSRIGNLRAGVGHLALPLAQRGYEVVAIEPAQEMLDQLRAAATEKGLSLRALHAAAEALPLEPASLDLVIISDALHFLDSELPARQIARVLAPRGALALVTCGFGQSRSCAAWSGSWRRQPPADRAPSPSRSFTSPRSQACR